MKCLLYAILFLNLFVVFSEECQIQLKITGDFPKGEYIYPKVTLNGKNIYDHVFPAGNYNIEMSSPGYELFTKDIVIAEGQKVYLLKETLITKKRRINFDISSNISNRLSGYSVSVAQFSKQEEVVTITNGDFLKPNRYLFTIRKPGYQTLDVNAYIWPDVKDYTLAHELQAKRVRVNLGNFSKSSRVYFKKNARMQVKDGQGILPGKYDIEVYDREKLISKGHVTVVPSEDEFVVSNQKNLQYVSNKYRPLVFNCVDVDNAIISPYFVDDLEKKYVPGENIHLRIAFKNYKTVEIDEIMPNGVGPHIINIPLHKLQTIEFSTFPYKKIIDDFKYTHEFFVDGVAIEPHLVEVTPGFSRDAYILKCLSENPKEITYYSGYRHYKGKVEKDGGIDRVGLFKVDISIERLIRHLTVINSKRKVRAIEKVISDKDLWKALRKRQAEVPTLITFLQQDEFLVLNKKSVTKTISFLKTLLK